MKNEFKVEGRILDLNKRPLVGVTVRAFDRDLPSLKRDELLGETITDAKGLYAIGFTEDKFRHGESGRGDVYIEVSANGSVLGKSNANYKPGRDLRIDLTV